MIHGNNKQLAGSWVNLPPDGSPQDLGKASSSIFLSRIHSLQQPVFWGREGKVTLRRHTVYIFHNSFKLAHEYPLISGPGLRKWGGKNFKITWTYLGAQGKYKTGLDFLFPFSLSPNPLQCSCLENPRDGGLPSMGSHRIGHDWSDLASKQAWEEKLYFYMRPKKGLKSVSNSFLVQARNLATQHFLPVLLLRTVCWSNSSCVNKHLPMWKTFTFGVLDSIWGKLWLSLYVVQRKVGGR